MEEEFICVRCARHMKTCCQISEVYVSPGDEQRIREHTGETGFSEFRPAEHPSYLDEDGDKTWMATVFREDGTRRIMKRRANGDCTFLGEAGCRLPLEVRPLICRLYPFDYDDHGIREEALDGCPLELLRPGQGILEALDMHRADAERWRAQLYREIRREEHARAPAGEAR